MARWERDTPWRQGQLLTADAVDALGVGSNIGRDDIAAIVISHDCDLAQGTDVEPIVEFIVGRFIDTAHGSFTNCKNLRKLHLDCTGGVTPRTIELLVGNRKSVQKISVEAPSLSDYLPRRDIAMTFRERRILQRWLAARYERASFSDEFDRRLRNETGVAERISAAFKDSGNDVVAIFFDVDEGREVVRTTKEDPYELAITLVYSTTTNPHAAQNTANTAAQRIREIFARRCRVAGASNAGAWHWIQLTEVDVISDEALTFAQSQLFVRWQADHISLREDPIQPMINN